MSTDARYQTKKLEQGLREALKNRGTNFVRIGTTITVSKRQSRRVEAEAIDIILDVIKNTLQASYGNPNSRGQYDNRRGCWISAELSNGRTEIAIKVLPKNRE